MDGDNPSRISEIAAIHLRSSALFFDAIQALLDIFAIGIIVNRILAPMIFMLYLTWFWVLGVSFIKVTPEGKKQLSGSIFGALAAFLAKFIPVLDFTIGLAAWSMSVHFTIKNTRAEDAGKKTRAAKPAGRKKASAKRKAAAPRAGQAAPAQAKPSAPATQPRETKPAGLAESSVGREVRQAQGSLAAGPEKAREKKAAPAQRPPEEVRNEERGREGRDVERQAEKEVDREFGYASSANVFDPYREALGNPDEIEAENTDFVGLPAEEIEGREEREAA